MRNDSPTRNIHYPVGFSNNSIGAVFPIGNGIFYWKLIKTGSFLIGNSNFPSDFITSYQNFFFYRNIMFRMGKIISRFSIYRQYELRQKRDN